MIESYKDFDKKNPLWLYAEDIGDKQVTLKIADMNGEKVADDGDGEKLALVFEGKKKRLLLCKTNIRRLQRLFGREPKNAIGKEITIASQVVDAFGADCDAIRIIGAPWLNSPVNHLEQKGKKKIKIQLMPTGKKDATP